jgi:hypothetical protein
MAKRAGVEQDEFPHRLLASLENRPMGAKLIDGARPFLVWRIIGRAGDLRDLAQPLSRRFDVLAMFLFSHVADFSVRSQA